MPNLGLHLIKNPAGTYSFAGRVPWNLGYIASDATEVKRQLMLPSAYRTIKCRVFTSIAGAIAVAKDLGYNVECSPTCACLLSTKE